MESTTVLDRYSALASVYHGMVAAYRQRRIICNSDQNDMELPICYVDYQNDFLKKRFNEREQYGVALARPLWALCGLQAGTDPGILGYAHRYWDGHQDALIFGRHGTNH